MTLRHMRVMVNGRRLFFDVEGVGLDGRGELDERPTLVLLHGSPGNSDHTVFKPYFHRLADIAQVVYLDLLGCGRSDESNDGHYSLDRWADDLVGFCDALDIDQPIVLGNSAGGMVAATYGIRHPEHPAKLILSSTQARLDPVRCIEVFDRLGGAEAAEAAKEALVESGNGAAFARYAEVCMPHYNTTTPTTPRNTTFRLGAAKVFHQLGGIWHTMDFTAELDQIRCPTLVIAGTEDPVTPIDDSRDIVAAMHQDLVRFEPFDDAGHGVWIDKPERAFDVLRDFILN